MKIIEYHCKLFSEPITYQLVQFAPNKDLKLLHGQTLIGTIAKVDGKCVQTGGRQVLDEMLEEIAQLL